MKPTCNFYDAASSEELREVYNFCYKMSPEQVPKSIYNFSGFRDGF
jgi:hypothetical protein